jgi:capsular polysaccharide transport system ATP-binding protein
LGDLGDSVLQSTGSQLIEFLEVRKSFQGGNGRKIIADGLSFRFPRNAAIALLGQNGAGKSTLLRMIAGSILPDSGKVIRRGSVSWPVGFSGGFHPQLTGLQNIRFIARIYGVDCGSLVDLVKQFSDLGAQLNLPVKSYSTGMKSRLAFGAAMAIPFDMYLVDEATSVGDLAFKAKSEQVFAERLQNSAAVIATHSLGLVKRLCHHGLVLDAGKLTFYPDVDDAIGQYQALAKQAGPQAKQ